MSFAISTPPNTGRRPMPAEVVKSVDRALHILQHIADSGGTIGLSRLASEACLPLPTVHRIVRSLLAHDYVRQVPSRQYALGPRLVRLGEAASGNLGSWALPQLRALVEATGETASMAMFNNDDVVYLAEAPSSHSMRTSTPIGRRVLPHATAVGKALLAQCSDDQVRALLERTGLPVLTPNTVVTTEALISELVVIRRSGYAVDHEEEELGACCVAVAVPETQIRVAISVAGPSTRVTAARVPQLAATLQRAASHLGAEVHRGRGVHAYPKP